MRILGIDPGLNTTGYGVLEIVNRKVRLVEAGVVRGKTKGSLTARVREIHEGVADVIASLKPQVLALEKIYAHYDRPTTAILMGHARGVIVLAAAQAGIDVHDYAATQVKKSLTDNGRAPKSQMQLAVQRELRLSTLPEPADVADALAIALCHIYSSPVSAGGLRLDVIVKSSVTPPVRKKFMFSLVRCKEWDADLHGFNG